MTKRVATFCVGMSRDSCTYFLCFFSMSVHIIVWCFLISYQPCMLWRIAWDIKLIKLYIWNKLACWVKRVGKKRLFSFSFFLLIHVSWSCITVDCYSVNSWNLKVICCFDYYSRGTRPIAGLIWKVLQWRDVTWEIVPMWFENVIIISRHL